MSTRTRCPPSTARKGVYWRQPLCFGAGDQQNSKIRIKSVEKRRRRKGRLQRITNVGNNQPLTDHRAAAFQEFEVVNDEQGASGQHVSKYCPSSLQPCQAGGAPGLRTSVASRCLDEYLVHDCDQRNNTTHPLSSPNLHLSRALSDRDRLWRPCLYTELLVNIRATHIVSLGHGKILMVDYSDFLAGNRETI